ncbi:MAG TPA: efflux transporter outer membrane subunit [Sphingobium sp.]|nr:efflux transporter outer membrane subunit [Sphingobium sp.]
MKGARIAIACLLVGACAPVIPPLAPGAAVDPPMEWRTAVGPTAPVQQGWWQLFGDPVLDSLVEQALVSNTDVAIAAARVHEARAQEALTRSQLFPTLDLGIGAVRQRAIGPLGAPTTSSAIQPVFQAAYEVDLFGRIGNQVEAARQGYLASQAARDAAALSVAAATATGYITLRALDARLVIAQTTLTDRAEALRLARNRARIGYTSDLELRQAEAEYEATAQLVPQLRLAATRQENALSLLIGSNPGPIMRGRAIGDLQRPPMPDALPSELLRRRPDIVQAEFTVAASDATLAAARAQFLPQIRLSGTAGAVVSSALGDPVAIWSLGGSVLEPILNARRNRGTFDTAAARREQAAFGYRRTVLTAFREVEDSLAAVARHREQLAALEAQRVALESALGHARNRYQAGYTSYLEQLDAQRALLSAELSVIQTEADELNAAVALFQATGGGWPAIRSQP